MRFGLVDFHKNEDIKEAMGGKGPTIHVVVNGVAYRNVPMAETYHFLYEFIQIGWFKDNVYGKSKIEGRPTLPGIYKKYWWRGFGDAALHVHKKFKKFINNQDT